MLILGVYAPHVALRAIARHVELVPHAYCIVKLLLCRCIVVVVELLLCRCIVVDVELLLLIVNAK